MSKLVERLKVASENNENIILDQLENDILLASDSGSLITEQYTMKAFSDHVLIHDLINDEYIRAYSQGQNIAMQDVKGPTLNAGDSVTWLNNDGKIIKGVLLGSNDGKATVNSNGKTYVVDMSILVPDNGSTSSFSNFRDKYNFLIDAKGDIKAYGFKQSLGNLLKQHPDWKMVTQTEYNCTVKHFSSDRMFTRQNRVWCILDKNGKLVRKVDMDLVGGQLAANPGYTAIKDVEYRKSLQKSPKFL